MDFSKLTEKKRERANDAIVLTKGPFRVPQRQASAAQRQVGGVVGNCRLTRCSAFRVRKMVTAVTTVIAVITL